MAGFRMAEIQTLTTMTVRIGGHSACPVACPTGFRTGRRDVLLDLRWRDLRREAPLDTGHQFIEALTPILVFAETPDQVMVDRPTNEFGQATVLFGGKVSQCSDLHFVEVDVRAVHRHHHPLHLSLYT